MVKKQELAEILKEYLPVSARMRSIIPEGESGKFKIKRKTIPKGSNLQMYSSNLGRIEMIKFPIEFPEIVLEESGSVWMSSSPFEIEGVAPVLDKISDGDTILMGGLGIGLLPVMCNMMTDCRIKRFDIVEIERDIIKLVTDLRKECSFPCRVIHDDIWNYLRRTEEKYDLIHIDIWGSFTASIKEIERASEASKRCLKSEGKVHYWLQELWENIKEKLPREPVQNPKSVGIWEPCLICGKTLRYDFAGLCMDCADAMGVSELFRG